MQWDGFLNGIFTYFSGWRRLMKSIFNVMDMDIQEITMATIK